MDLLTLAKRSTSVDYEPRDCRRWRVTGVLYALGRLVRWRPRRVHRPCVLLNIHSHYLLLVPCSMADRLKPIEPKSERWVPTADPNDIVVPGLDMTASANDQIEQIEQLITIKLQVLPSNSDAYLSTNRMVNLLNEEHRRELLQNTASHGKSYIACCEAVRCGHGIRKRCCQGT